MTNARFLFPIAALALAFADAGCNKTCHPSSPPSARPVELKLKWTPGEHIVEEFNTAQTILDDPPVKEDIILPSNPVRPGDTWPVKIQSHMGPLGTLDMSYNLTFKGWEMFGKRNCARIEISGGIETEPGGGPGPFGMTVTKGNVSGALWFDPEFGTVVSSKMNQDMTFLVTAHSMSPEPPQTSTNQLNQAIDFKVDSLE